MLFTLSNIDLPPVKAALAAPAIVEPANVAPLVNPDLASSKISLPGFFNSFSRASARPLDFSVPNSRNTAILALVPLAFSSFTISSFDWIDSIC